MNVCSKLECWFFQPSLIFVGKTLRTHIGLGWKDLTGALLTNIVSGLKGLPGTNTIAHCEHSKITDIKNYNFGSRYYKTYMYPLMNKLERLSLLGTSLI